MGNILASFIASGKIPSLIDLLYIEAKMASIAVLAILTNFVDIPKMSVVFEDLRDWIIRFISCGVVSLMKNEHLLGFFR